jgi:hypothetical protein
MLQLARVSNDSRSEGMLRLLGRSGTRLVDMTRHGIDEMSFIAERGQPASIGTGPATDIEHPGGRGLNMAEDQLLGARVLELKPSRAKTRGFVGLSVVPNDFVSGVVGHKWI